MTSLAERLARPEILALPPFDISANANADFARDAVKLDANENPYPPLVRRRARRATSIAIPSRSRRHLQACHGRALRRRRRRS